MRESLQAKVVFRAAQLRGGSSELALVLRVSVHDVQAWMRSDSPIPEPVYFELLDIIAKDAVAISRAGVRE